MNGAETVVFLVQAWGLVGVCVAAGFLTFGVGQIDEDAQDALTFRILLVPGIMVIWPLVVWRWWILATGRDHWPARHAPPRQRHAIVALLLAVMIPLTLITAFSIRQAVPPADAPVLLEEGQGS